MAARRIRPCEANHLTRAGRELVPLVEGLGVWGQRWTRRGLAPGEVDVGLLIWSLERSVRGEALRGGRRTVELELSDPPAGLTGPALAPGCSVSAMRTGWIAATGSLVLLAAVAGCAGPTAPRPPLYSPAEQRAQCERAGGWWHGDFCEPNSQM